METLEPILAVHPFFKGLDERYLKLVVGCAANVRFEAGQFIARTDEEAVHFYLINHGQVAIEIFAPGRGAITIQTLGEGDIFGWSWIVPPYRWRFDARAVELTRAISLDGKCLRGKCEDDHDFGYVVMRRLLHVVSSRLLVSRLQLIDMFTSPEEQHAN